MKVTELMVGDWVNTPDGNGIIRLINAIDERFVVRVMGMDCWFLPNVVSPIPLTDGILAFNGWQYGDWGNEYENDEYFTNETIGFDLHINSKKEFEIRCVDAVNITLKFVHELQHALKLCGIEKDIEL